MELRKRYRKCLLVTLFISIMLFCAGSFYLFQNSIPEKIKLVAGEKNSFHFSVPGKANINEEEINLQEPFAILAGSSGVYQMDCKLFGMIDLKQIELEVVAEKQVVPGGMPIGIYLETDGVLIIGTGKVTGADGLDYDPARQKMKAGDYIIAVNGQKVRGKQDIIRQINEQNGEDVIFDIRRNQESIQVKVAPILCNDQTYKTGIWVRDNTQGIGTLTFYDKNGSFGALGHGINDYDTSTLLEVDEGLLYQTHIMAIRKGERGNPGELAGYIDYQEEHVLGSIQKNTGQGIFGTLQEQAKETLNGESVPVAMKQEIEKGTAWVRSMVSGEMKEYEIQILDVRMTEENANKGMVIQVTDPELLSLTGGIVQGMSGSPILQNGKIIGAVTHVFVQDPTKGFGIFIENMLYSKD